MPDGARLRDELGDLFEEAPIPYVHEGLDSRFIRANRAARALLGIRADEVTGTFGKTLVAGTPESRRRLLDAFASIARGGEPVGIVLELRRKDDGRTVWVEWSSKPAANGLFTRTMLVDITQRVLIEQTKAALEFSLESGHVGEWDLDLITDTSRRSLRHDRCFGDESPVPNDDWGAAAFIRHVHPDDRERVDAVLRQAVLSLRQWSAEFRVVWPDASSHWLVAKGNVYRLTADGKAARMLGVVMDITASKKAEEALHAAERSARGQVEALTRSIDAMAAESAPDRLPEHILRTMARQLGAHSCSVWLRDAATGLFDLQCALEDDRYLSRADPTFDSVALRIPMDAHWRDALNADEAVVMADIRLLRDAAWRQRLIDLGVITVLMVPMSIAGRVEGTIGIRFTCERVLDDAEIALARALANQTMLALQLARLSSQASESAVTAERNRLARDIHDTLAQGFTGVIVQLEAASDAASKGLPGEAQTHVERARGLARDSLREARRSVRALRPPALDHQALPEALDAMVRTSTEATALTADFAVQGAPRRLPAEWDMHLLRVVQEGLTNALKHSGARRFHARLRFEADALSVSLVDDGEGFDPSRRHDGFGLIGIGERVAVMGGTLAIDTAPGAGTRLTLTVPWGDDVRRAAA